MQELNASFASRAKSFRDGIAVSESPGTLWKLHPAHVIGTFASVKKRAGLCAILALLIASFLSACASSKEEGVVTESTEQKTTAAEAHFARPSFAPSGEGGTSSAHSGF